MWVNCHKCNGYGFLIDNKKNEIPCFLCNHNNLTYVYLVGQIWVEDDYEPIEKPEEPN